MSDSLLIRLQHDGRFSWLTLDAQGRAAAGTSDGVPPKQTVSRAQRVVAVVPAADVLLLDTPRLSAARAQFAKAVPFALEDQLIAPVEDLQFAVAEKLGERVPVAIVARKTLRGWIEHLAAHGITADVVVAETQLLAAGDAGTIVIDGERALWRTGPAQAGVFETAELTDWLGVIRGDAPARPMDIYDFRTGSFPPVVDASVTYHPQQRDLLAFLATHVADAAQINLLQGDFAAVHRRAPTQTLWRNAAILSAAALVLLFVFGVADYMKVARESDQLDAASRQILHDTFPQMDNVPGDPRQLMQSALDNLRGGADSQGLLHLLMQIGPVLSGTTRTTLTNIEFHNATLELALRAPDVPTLDLMRERLANVPGLTVQVTAANTGANGVEGRLRIVGGKS